VKDITIQSTLESLMQDPSQKVERPVEGKSFQETLKESLEKVNELQKEADEAVKKLATGEGGNIHETMLAIEKADISFRMMMQVRNKIVEAYQEIMRMQT